MFIESTFVEILQFRLDTILTRFELMIFTKIVIANTYVGFIDKLCVKNKLMYQIIEIYRNQL